MLGRAAQAAALRNHVLPLIAARGTLVRTPQGAECISRTTWICT